MKTLPGAAAIAVFFAGTALIAAPVTIPGHFEKRGSVFIRRGRETAVFDSHGVKTASVRMAFVHPRAAVVPEGREKFAGKVNYLTGSNPRDWETGIESYARLRYRGLYPGISLDFRAAGDGLEYDFAVAPYANPATIRLRFSGGPVRLDRSGDLVIVSAAGVVRHRKPVAYQIVNEKRRPVPARFVLGANGNVQFALGKYDRRAILVIDPVIVYETTVSGTGSIYITAVAADGQGNIYVAGTTSAPDLPVTPGSLSPPPAGSCFVSVPGFMITCQQVFAAKLNADGSSFSYLTYLGGSGSDTTHSIAIDAAGNLYVAGSTTSADFPTTSGALQKNLIASSCPVSQPGLTGSYPCSDGFALKLNPSGDALVYSTLLGGSGDDQLAGVKVDAQGNAWLAGYTTSTDFPVTAGAFQTKLSGPSDGFISRLNADGTALLESTLLGGSGTDQITALAVDTAGNAYVGGETDSSDFPVTTGSLQATYGGGTDAFVAKFWPDSTTPVYATYYGGPDGEILNSIQADAEGNAYLGGTASAFSVPLGTGVFLFGDPQAILVKIDPQGSSVLFKNTALSSIQSLVVDSQGRVTALGDSIFTSAPLTANALSTCGAGGPFLLRLEADGQTVRYGSYVSGQSIPIAVIPAQRVPLPASGNALSYFTNGLIDPASLVTIDSLDNVYLAGAGTIEKQDFSQDPSAAATCLLGFTESLPDAIAPGEIVSIYGRNLGPQAGALGALDASGRLPFRLQGVTVSFDDVPAPVWYAQANQINTIVPFEVAGHASTKITISYNGVSASLVQAVRPASNVILASNGQAIAVNQDGSINSNAHPAKPGSVVTIYSSGGGQTNPPSVDGEVMQAAAPLVLPVQVFIGNGQVSADVLYAGSAPGQMAGIVQVNFVVPENLPPNPFGGTYQGQNVVLVIGSQQFGSSSETIFVGP